MDDLTEGMQHTLSMFSRMEFWPAGSLWLNGVRKRYCGSLVKRGLLERTDHPHSEGWKLTDKGRAALNPQTAK